MKRKLSFLCLLLSLVFALSIGFAACGGGNDDPGEGGTSSNYSASSGKKNSSKKPQASKPTGSNVITYWYNGGEEEQELFTSLVNQFNSMPERATDKIFIDAKYQSDIEGSLSNILGTDSAPDVFNVNDGTYKGYVENGYLYDISDMAYSSEVANPEDMWDSIYDRYYYSTTNHRAGADADSNGAWYGLPKDIGPTVIYYNEDMFEKAGVQTISVAAEDLDAFNGGEITDDRGQLASELSDYPFPEKGYFILDGKKFFNNQVCMSWEEVRDLSVLIADANSTPTKTVYGYHTEWWFAYGWSVGGDCLQYIDAGDFDTYDGGGYYDFTLVDDTVNYIVNEGKTFKINNHTYKAGETISYGDKLLNETSLHRLVDRDGVAQYDKSLSTAVANGTLTELPSQREAFIEFVLLSTDKGVYIDGTEGYAICNKPSSMGGDGAKSTTFQNGSLGMLVDGRWNCNIFRKPENVSFKWDVAPLPIYKEYDSAGNIIAQGREAGHTGSVVLSINSALNATKAAQAFKFVEFIAGSEGQTAQSLSGFAIPSQPDIASDPNNNWLDTNGNGVYDEGIDIERGIFINQKDDEGNLLRPYNSEIFLRAAKYQSEGDWCYTKNGSGWIDDWAGLLNGPVRNGSMTFAEFVTDIAFTSTWTQLESLTLKKKS